MSETTTVDPKNPLASKINILAALAIVLPYINKWLSTNTGMPIVVEPEAAYTVLLAAIIVVRTLWTQAGTSLTRIK